MLSSAQRRAVTLAIAAVWFITGALVVTTPYREVGEAALARLGLPAWLMWATCAGEILLAAHLVAFGITRVSAGLQVAAIVAFTVILAIAVEPMLLVHPYGMLSKNLPLACLIVLSARADLPRARELWLWRFACALPWFTEGLFPKILFQQELELAFARKLGLSHVGATWLVATLGGLQIASGVCALALPPRRAAYLAQLQALSIIGLTGMVTLFDPAAWLHPFGPLTKNIPLVVATLVVAQILRQRSRVA